MATTTSSEYIPVPRADGLMIQPVGDECVVYDLESKQAHCLRPLAAFVLSACDGEASIATIAAAAARAVDPSVTDATVRAAVDELEASKLLTPPPVMVMQAEGVSRREVVRRIAFVGAAATTATTFMTTVVAPGTAFATCNAQPQGCNCTKTNPNGNLVQVNTLCSSGHCCGAGGSNRCNIGCCTSSNNGSLCDCSAKVGGTCQAVPTPGNAADCCNGVCTPSVAGSAC